MAMGKRKRHAKQAAMWVATHDLPRTAAHPFYTRLNQILDTHDFDGYVEGLCARFYADDGRPGLPPGRYFRLLLIGYFEGLDAERAIAWRAADSFALREFLGLVLPDAPPDHSTISRTRRLIDLETHEAVFTWMLQRLADAGLVKGKTVGIDATTLEANAALRSIVRRDTGESYQDFLTKLAQASGIETPTRADLARIDRTRKKKGSNDDWTHPHDPDAKITKMKDGRTHLAHKAEHALDLETGAIVGATVQGADQGDTTTTSANPIAGRNHGPTNTPNVTPWMRIAVASEALAETPPSTTRELLERPCAHLYETGGLRRTHVRGHTNVLKRLLIHASAFNLGLWMRKLFGIGTPRALQGRVLALQSVFGLLGA
jgi:transposase